MSTGGRPCPACGDPLGSCTAQRRTPAGVVFLCPVHGTDEINPASAHRLDHPTPARTALQSEDTLVEPALQSEVVAVHTTRQDHAKAHLALVTALDVEHAPPDEAARVLDALHASEHATAHTRRLTEAVILEWLRDSGTDELEVGERRFWASRSKRVTLRRDLPTALTLLLPLLIDREVRTAVDHDDERVALVFRAVAGAVAELFPASALRHGACRELLRSAAERTVRQNTNRFLRDDGSLDTRTPLSQAEQAQADTLLRRSWDALFETSWSPQTRLQTAPKRPR